MRYTLTNQEDLSEMVIEITEENVNETALKVLGYSVKCSEAVEDSDDIKLYYCVDDSDDTVVFNFYEGWKENACFAALNELGYDIAEGDWHQPKLSIVH